MIHAMTSSVRPVERAFGKISPETKLVHFMDTELLSLLQSEKSITPQIIRRFSRLVESAAESDADCIQLTCSAFNELTSVLQPLSDVKIFRSDEAMLDTALNYERIGIVSTVNETPPVLINYLREKKKSVNVQTLINTEALQRLFHGNQEAHDKLVTNMVYELEGETEVIILSQYSQAHIAEQLSVSVPVLTGPDASVKRCLEYMEART
jgi:Asp/Glu/hydantoin racemase